MKRSDQNNLRIVSKQCAHCQDMTLTPVKCQRDWSYTRYQLLEGGRKDERTEGWNYGSTECQILCSLAFLRKCGGQTYRITVLKTGWKIPYVNI